jgi:hypothetical protein
MHGTAKVHARNSVDVAIVLHDAICVRSLAVLTCECSETCIMAMHVVSQDDLISIAQFDLDQNQNISSPQTDCNSLLSLCPCIKQFATFRTVSSSSLAHKRFKCLFISLECTGLFVS